jgi:hypothetical protein
LPIIVVILIRGVSEAKGGRATLLIKSLCALLGALRITPHCPQEPDFNYRESYRYYYRDG